MAPDPHDPYILGTGDKIRIFVYGQPNLSRIYAVDQAGDVAFPLIGNVRARGRASTDLARAIRARLGRDFVRDPFVTVDVAQNRPFFILGEVRLPGQYPYVSGMSVETAVAIAGGYTERASERRFRITRRLGALIDQIGAPSDYPGQPGVTGSGVDRFL
jgi:polysaccharide export outer membrane protein